VKLSLRPRCVGAGCHDEVAGFIVFDSGKSVGVCQAHIDLARFKGYEVVDIDSVIASVLAEERVAQ
jgi:hypothetical protein